MTRSARALMRRTLAEQGIANCRVAFVARMHAQASPAHSALRRTWRNISKQYEELARDSANALFNHKEK